MKATNLYRRYTQAELLALRVQVENDPANQNKNGGIFIYTKAARRKLDEIDRAITWHIQDKRKAEGRDVPISGYSGRQTNRR